MKIFGKAPLTFTTRLSTGDDDDENDDEDGGRFLLLPVALWMMLGVN